MENFPIKAEKEDVSQTKTSAATLDLIVSDKITPEQLKKLSWALSVIHQNLFELSQFENAKENNTHDLVDECVEAI